MQVRELRSLLWEKVTQADTLKGYLNKNFGIKRNSNANIEVSEFLTRPLNADRNTPGGEKLRYIRL